MKLAEALAERAALTTRLTHLAQRAAQHAQVQEGEEPVEDPAALLVEHDQVAAQLAELIARINRTNLATTLADGTTLTDALAHRDVLRLSQQAWAAAADAGAARTDRYSRSEIRHVAAIDVAATRKRADELAREWRELDVRIQEANWSNEI
ncbi:DIP1984 family protein [Ornithinimicrobium panacihumi]|uniref:DIP1984 family protein n=1 Tax=Ornithinimicrobium panacihumi TaxID=2008449 RepID=UPI003F8C3126